MKQKTIFVSVVLAAVLTVTGIATVGMTDVIQTASVEPKIGMVIDDNDYVRGGLLPPDDYILDFGDGLDLEDNRGENSPYYNDVKELFYGYDEIVIIDHIRENDDSSFVEPRTTYIFLTKEPFGYETLTGEFYYDMLGITIILAEKTPYMEPFSMQTEINPNSVYKEISEDLFGVGRDKFRAQMIDDTWFDLPTTLHFLDNQNAVSIKGFLTLDQASELAKAIMR